MNKDNIRRQFRKYRKRIAQLEEQIADLEYQQEEAYFAQEATISRAEKNARACENERFERERQAEADRWYHEEELKKATSDLERARSYGDEWGESRAIEKLKRISF